MNRIRFDGIAKSYGRVAALSDIDLEVAPDRLTVFFGPPGSGKSVLLRLLVGLEQPGRGRILLDNVDITALPAAKRTIGYVPQSFALFPHMSVFDNIAYPMALQGVGGEEIARRVDEAAAVLRIGPLLQKQPSQLSGGEKQRAAIARGILKNAHIFILDDPLIGLDFKLRESLMEDLAEMRAQLGATFLYATADPLEALVMAEDLVVMDRGRVIEANAADRLYHRPSQLRAAELTGFPRCNVISGRIEGGECVTPLLRFPVVLDAPGADVAVVVRPEGIGCMSDAGGTVSGTGEIQLLENLGAECVLYFTFAGQLLVTTAPSPVASDLGLGDRFPFVLRPERMLVYDRGSGSLIGHGTEVGRA